MKKFLSCFDEMKVEERWSYDRSSDRIYKPYVQVQVALLREFIWKQPIYYTFDQRMTRDILLSLINQVEKAGYPVVCITSDMGSTNSGHIKHYKFLLLRLILSVLLIHLERRFCRSPTPH